MLCVVGEYVGVWVSSRCSVGVLGCDVCSVRGCEEVLVVGVDVGMGDVVCLCVRCVLCCLLVLLLLSLYPLLFSSAGGKRGGMQHAATCAIHYARKRRTTQRAACNVQRETCNVCANCIAAA